MNARNRFKSWRSRKVRNRLNIIIGLIILILLFGLLNFWLSIKVMNGVRAYVGGEGLWSKAQKEAVNNLVRYTISEDETDYEKFLALTSVQAGDKQARLELDKPKPNPEIVKQGFIQGGNHPNDVADLTFLYRRFKDVSYMRSAIQSWTKGDQEIENLLEVGSEIHALISIPQADMAEEDRVTRQDELSALLDEVYAIDVRLTVLENRFSATLSEGARGITTSIIQVTLLTTGLLGVLTLVVAVLSARSIVRVDKLKSGFVSVASHQLRTPLTAISWSSEALLSPSTGQLNETQKKYVEHLYSGSQRMANLIDDLLRATSLDLGTYILEISDVNIRDTIETVVKEQQKAVDQKAITLAATIDPDLPIVQTDGQLLTEILQNLLSNSIKYTPQGGHIAVHAHHRKSHIYLGVIDNGMGIPSEQQAQIFTKLFRADNARQLDSNGTGLGLYVAKAMVKRLNGTIWFESTEGKGSSFYVKLPAHRAVTKEGKDG